MTVAHDPLTLTTYYSLTINADRAGVFPTIRGVQVKIDSLTLTGGSLLDAQE